MRGSGFGGSLPRCTITIPGIMFRDVVSVKKVQVGETKFLKLLCDGWLSCYLVTKESPGKPDLPPSDWPVGMCMGAFSCFMVAVGGK